MHRTQRGRQAGLHPNEQFKLLNEALLFFKTLQFSGAEKRFIVGGSISISATIALQKQLKFQIFWTWVL